MSACNCKPGFDVRCCCEVKKGNWERCPMRISTAVFMCGNDIEIYEEIERIGIEGFDAFKYFGFDDQDAMEFREAWKEVNLVENA